MATSLMQAICKVLWNLFKFHLVIFLCTRVSGAFGFEGGQPNSSGSHRSSGCPIMRTKAFLGRSASILSNSMRWNLVHGPVGTSSFFQSPSQAMLYLCSRDSFLRLNAEAAETNSMSDLVVGDQFINRGSLTLMDSDAVAYSVPKTSKFDFRLYAGNPMTTMTAQTYTTITSSTSSSSSSSSSHGSPTVTEINEAMRSPAPANPLPPNTPSDNEVIVMGLSHHNAGVDVREKLAIPEAEWNAVATALAKLPSISEASVLSTCNRFEIYLAGPDAHACIRDAMDFLVKRSKGSLDHATLRKSLFMLTGDDAVWHLLRVAGGLDSLVVGEGQILAQVKRSHELCAEGEDAPAGKVLAKLLNMAVAAGKRARAETGIAKGAVSISSAAAQFTALKIAQDCQIEHLSDANLAIIGSGKMARLLLVHLQSQGVRKITIVNRSPNRIEELKAEFPELDIEFELMDKLWDVVARSDVVFPATSATSVIIDPEQLNEAMRRRVRPGGIQFIDISVPRNVHPGCSEIPGVFNYNVDFLKAAVDRNTAMRQKEIVEVENLLREELGRFQLWRKSLGAIPTISQLQQLAEAVRKEEIEKVNHSLMSNLSTKEQQQVERLSKNIVAKLMHGPMSHLRSHKEGGAAAISAISHLRQAFQLP